MLYKKETESGCRCKFLLKASALTSENTRVKTYSLDLIFVPVSF